MKHLLIASSLALAFAGMAQAQTPPKSTPSSDRANSEVTEHAASAPHHSKMRKPHAGKAASSATPSELRSGKAASAPMK